jgi:hypothetical protein
MSNNEDIKDIEEVSDEEIQKTKGKTKEKKPYVLTDARKAQFEKARQVRQANIEAKKKEQEEKDALFEQIKRDLEKKKDKKHAKQQKSQIKKLIEEVESDSDEEIVVKKVKAPKKKIIYVESDPSEDEEDIIEKKKPVRREQKPIVEIQQPVPVKYLKPVIRYF